jgi:2,3-bisphosphoglycerate-independent phosphoglycerate mutase
MIWHNGKTEVGFLAPPHDISGRVIANDLDQNPEAASLICMMRDSYALLKDHPVNEARIARGKRPANSIWLWGQGKKPSLMAFKDKFGLNGAVVSAVDLLKGIGKCAGMCVPDVKGVTGYIDTNWGGKVDAALQALQNKVDFVYIHLEAPDECGHRGEVANKVKSIELIDEKILSPLVAGLKRLGEYRIMILPDHPTPLDMRTHSSEPVPYLIFNSTSAQSRSSSVTNFNEVTAKNTGIFRDNGSAMMRYFLNKG